MSCFGHDHRLGEVALTLRRLLLEDVRSRTSAAPRTLPVAVSLKRFLAPEWVFIFGIGRPVKQNAVGVRLCSADARWQERRWGPATRGACRRPNPRLACGAARPRARFELPRASVALAGGLGLWLALSVAGLRVVAAASASASSAVGSACSSWCSSRRTRGVAALPSSACFSLLAGEHRLRRRQHHRHVAAVLERRLLDHGDLRQLAGEPVEQRGAALGVGDLAAAEHDRDLDLVLAQQEPRDVALLGVVVVLRDLRAELDLADRDLLLVLARGLQLLGLLVLVLRVVEHAADGRARLGGDLDEVEIALLRVASASAVLTTPICFPSSPTSRTSGTRIRSLIRVWSRSGGRRSNLRGTGTSCWWRRCVKRRRAVCDEALGSTTHEYSGVISVSRTIFDLVRARARRTRRRPPIPRRRAGARAARPRPDSCSRSPTTSMYGILRSSASRILRPTDSLRSSTSARTPAAAQPLATTVRRVVDVAVGDRQHDRLHRRQPHRQLAGEVLEQDPDEALVGAHQRAVDHHRPVLGVVGAGVGEPEALPACCSRADRSRAATSGRASRSCACRSSGRRRRRRPR